MSVHSLIIKIQVAIIVCVFFVVVVFGHHYQKKNNGWPTLDTIVFARASEWEREKERNNWTKMWSK